MTRATGKHRGHGGDSIYWDASRNRFKARWILASALAGRGGHTHKEITARLFLSPRTVSAHLYQVIPKLGITSRAALRGALADETVE